MIEDGCYLKLDVVCGFVRGVRSIRGVLPTFEAVVMYGHFDETRGYKKCLLSKKWDSKSRVKQVFDFRWLDMQNQCITCIISVLPTNLLVGCGYGRQPHGGLKSGCSTNNPHNRNRHPDN